MRLTLDSKWKEVLLVLAALLLAACNLGQSGQTGSRSSPAGDGGTSGGSCTNVAICTLIPQSQVNTTLGVMVKFTSPNTPTNMGGMTSDQCAYNAGATAPGMHVELLRQCYPEEKFASVTYDGVRTSYLAPERLDPVSRGDTYLTVILGKDENDTNRNLHVEVAGHDGKDHKDDAIAVAREILAHLH